MAVSLDRKAQNDLHRLRLDAAMDLTRTGKQFMVSLDPPRTEAMTFLCGKFWALCQFVRAATVAPSYMPAASVKAVTHFSFLSDAAFQGAAEAG